MNAVHQPQDAPDEAMLNQMSAKAASYYATKKCQGMPMPEKTLAINANAHGFFMGWRECEKFYGIRMEMKRANVAE